jgi:two-component system C4-dicarboxylate transport sensor histidine kinase DctB
MRIRIALLALPPLVVLLIAPFMVQLMKVREQAGIDRQAAERLTLYRQTIIGEYNKYRYLPYMLARDPRATIVVDIQKPTEPANRFLQEMAENSGANLLYIMDRNGDTLAASNWQDELSLVGRNYGFRPYFQSAIKGEEGRFFAIGATIGEPGLFLSRPTPVNGDPIGVAVVKVDMRPLEQAWAEGGEIVFASDENGVIFLSSVPEWRYRLLRTLSDDVLTRIRETRQFAGRPLERLSGPTGNSEKQLLVEGRAYRWNQADVGFMGWQLHYLTPVVAANANAGLIWALAIGVSLLYAIALLILRGRALRQASALLKQESADLRDLNQRLVEEVEERRRVERELRTAQEGLARSSRLAAVGQMSAAVAHELNQPLAALRMFVAGTRKFLDAGKTDSARDNLGEIDALEHRMAILTQELKRFARPAESRIERVDLRDNIREAAKIALPRFEETGVDLEVTLPDDELLVETAPLPVEQVLLNLLRNGADAASSMNEGAVRLHVERREDTIAVLVGDNGKGVPDEIRDRIFDPFFTTKLSSGGLGLGLSISARIAEDIGGSLSVAGNEKGGATFEFCLPALREGAGSGVTKQGGDKQGIQEVAAE